MYRKPRWMKNYQKLKFGGRPQNWQQNNILGYLLCLIGGVIVLAVLPGWLYLLIIGAALLVSGVWVLRGK